MRLQLSRSSIVSPVDRAVQVKAGGPELALAVVRDLRDARAPAGPDELAAFVKEHGIHP